MCPKVFVDLQLDHVTQAGQIADQCLEREAIELSALDLGDAPRVGTDMRRRVEHVPALEQLRELRGGSAFQLGNWIGSRAHLESLRSEAPAFGHSGPARPVASRPDQNADTPWRSA